MKVVKKFGLQVGFLFGISVASVTAATGPVMPTVPPPPVTPPGEVRLVRLDNKFWSDNLMLGTKLADVTHLPATATIEAWLEGQPLDAIAVSGQSIHTGVGYAALPRRQYTLIVRVQYGSQVKHTVIPGIEKYSAGSADVYCTTESQFTDALTAASGSSGTYVIELDPSREWAPRVTATASNILLTVSGTRQVVIRSPGDPRTSPQVVMGSMRAGSTGGGHGIYFQNVKFLTRVVGFANMSQNYPTFEVVGTNPLHFFSCVYKGGVISESGVNPDQSYDPADMSRVGGLVFFRCAYPSSAGPIVSLQPVDGWTQRLFPGITAVGVETILETPLYVGDSLPGGVLPDVTGWPATGGVPLIFRKQAGWSGTEAAARFKAEYLADGPVGPGNYMTAVIIDTRGTGYRATSSGSPVTHRSDYTCTWSGHKHLNQMTAGINRVGSASPEMGWNYCGWYDLLVGIQIPIQNGMGKRAVSNCVFDRIYKDVMAWGNSGGITVNHTFNDALSFYRIVMGRSICWQQDYLNPHQDWLQLFLQGGNTASVWMRIIMLMVDCANARSGPQILFCTDVDPSSGDRYNWFIYGLAARGGASNGTVFTWAGNGTTERAMYLNHPLNANVGTPRYIGAQSFRDPKVYGTNVSENDIILINESKAASPLITRRNVLRAPASETNQALVFKNPFQYQFLDTPQKWVDSYEPLGALSGRGPFGDLTHSLDWIGGGYDPDMIPWRFSWGTISEAPVNTLFTTTPKQAPYGIKTRTLYVNAGTEWRKASSIDSTGALVSPTAWSSAPGPLAPLEWFEARRLSANGVYELTEIVITIDGEESRQAILTQDTVGDLLLNYGENPAYLRSANASAYTKNSGKKLLISFKVRTPPVLVPNQTITMYKGSGSSPLEINIFSGSNSLTVFVQTNPSGSGFKTVFTCPASGGKDYNFIFAWDFTVASPLIDDFTGLPLGTYAPGFVQAICNLSPMTEVTTNGINYSNVSPNGTGTLFLNHRTHPTIFAGIDGANIANDWGLHHMGIHQFTSADMPDFTQYENARWLSTTFFDSGPSGLPGSGLENVIGERFNILWRGTPAQANGSGIPNLGRHGIPPETLTAPAIKMSGDPFS